MKNARATGKDRLVKEQEAKRKAAIEQLEATPSPPEPPEQEQPSAEPTPAAAPSADDTPPTQGKEPPSDTEPKPERKAIDREEGSPDSATQAALWQERYRTLQTKYDAEVPRYAQQVKDLKAEIQELNMRLEKGTSILDKAQKSEHYQKLVNEYDEDTANSIAGLLSDLTQGQKPPSEPSESSPDQLGSYSEFRIVLSSELPGWEQKYNENDAFIDWAEATLDPQSGQSMLELLNRAALADFDPKVAKRIFSTFDRQVSKHPETAGHQYVEPAGDGGDGKAQPEAPTFRSGDLKHHQDLLRRNKITRQAFDKFQADFVKAQNEGRVMP